MTLQLSHYELRQHGNNWELAELAAQPASSVFKRDYDVYVVLRFGASIALAAYADSDGTVDLYTLREGEPRIALSRSTNIGNGWSELHGLTFSNDHYLMAYRADTGLFAFHLIDGPHISTKPYLYQRFHAPSPTRGFTMVRPFVQSNGVVLMGYTFDTGAICMYTLTGVVSSSSDRPPITAHAIWDHTWAPGWTRFAFFALGGEVFFLKTNTKYPNVNIDHVLDSPADGTAEVATQLDLPDAQILKFVEPFTLRRAAPHFAAYRPDGLTTMYQIHSDCTGWLPLTSTRLPPNADFLIPTLGDGDSQQFVCLSESSCG